MAVLTDARLAVWKAVENYPKTQGVFRQTIKYGKHQSNMMQAAEPSISDFPAIAIVPVSNTPSWYHHRQQHWIYFLDLTIWTPDWILEPAEDLLEKVCEAFWRSTPGGSSVPYLEPYMPFQTMGTASFSAETLNDVDGGEGTQVMVTRTQLALSIRKDPFGNL